MTNRNRTSSRVITKSKLYNRLSQANKTFEVRTERSTKAGVRIETRGAKKLTDIELLLPSSTNDGEARTVRIRMTGRQARALFETLSNHYDRNR